MYRPTVRYDDSFGEYVNALFQATTLDRNQIIRLALFSAPQNSSFLAQLEKHKKGDVPLPRPSWKVYEHGYWQDSEYKEERGGSDVNDHNELRRAKEGREDFGDTARGTGRVSVEKDRRQQPQPRCERKIHSRKDERHVFKNAGGITIKLG